MKNNNNFHSHYLSISYKALANKKIMHHILFIIEMGIILIQKFEIYYNDFEVYKMKDLNTFNPFIIIIRKIGKLPIGLNFIIYFGIICIIIINSYLLNNITFKINFYIRISVNVTEIFFFRVLTLLIFNYLFIFRGIYLIINIIITFPYLLTLILNFYKNYLFLFFPSIIKYPYDSFSMIIDFNLLILKIFLSISAMVQNKNISQFCFFVSLLILFVLLIHLTYIMKNKSYYFMNNCNLNKLRYTIILSSCIITIIVILFEKHYLHNMFYQISYLNIMILCLLFVYYFYDPYHYANFDKDDNIENVYYYFFILENNRHNYLLEEKIEKHLSLCNKCNLCQKYHEFKMKKKKENLDLYKVIYNGEDLSLNLMNNIFKEIIKNGKSNFINNSYYLINLIYAFYLSINKNNYNFSSNIELLFEIINEENSQYLEECSVSLNQIKSTNDFLIKAKTIIQDIYDMFDDNNHQRKIVKFFKLAEVLKELKFKEIQSINNRNNNNYNIDALPNCNNLLIICSLFYEELYNESISNSGSFIRETPNFLEDFINSNNKSIKQITLKIDIPNFSAKIIRAGGHMNKYENKNFFDLFPSIFKNKQIIYMKNQLINSNQNSEKKSEKNKNYKSKKKKEYNKENRICFYFIIEEKEENSIIYFRELKLKLRLILLTNINITIYLNGTYNLEKNIIITEHQKEREIVLYFGNNELINKARFNPSNNNTNNNNSIIIKNNKLKNFENDELIEKSNILIGSNKYTIYHLLSSKKKNLSKISKKNKTIKEDNYKEKINVYDENNELFIFNDIASQASSATTSITKNNLISFYRGNKKIKNDINFSKKINLPKYFLLFSLTIFFILAFFQTFYLSLLENTLKEQNNFYIILKDYQNNFDILFFSVLSFLCIADSIYSNKCVNLMNEVTKLAFLYINNNGLNIKSNDFINFTDFLIYENNILNENLNSKLDKLNKYYAKFNQEVFISNLKTILPYYKINQIIKNNETSLSLSQENLIFSDFIKLMNSRFGIIIKNYNCTATPIYILNKNEKEVFNNILAKERLDSSQEAIYLIILDYKTFSNHFGLVVREVAYYINSRRKIFKLIIYSFICLNVFVFFFILLLIFVYFSLYLFISFKLLYDIDLGLKEKIGDYSIKDILRKKIDNLKLLLNFYENDIGEIIRDLNNIYNDFQDKYNIKIKGDSRTKFLKKDGKNEKEKKNKNTSCSSIIHIFKQYHLFQYSKRRKLYFYNLLFIFILGIFIYIIAFYNIWTYFKLDETLYYWVSASHKLSVETSEFMNKFLLMFLNNQTFFGNSQNFSSRDYIHSVYSQLTEIYKIERYSNLLLKDMVIQDEKKLNFECETFYKETKNDFFEQLKSKFINEEDKLYNTMLVFCKLSNIMMFKNYKTIFLQLFSKVKNLIENFQNGNYNYIINYIKKYSIGKIEITFLFTYTFIMEYSFNNVKIVLLGMENKYSKTNFITGASFILLAIILLLVIKLVYIKNVKNDCNKFLQTKKVFKICDTSE